MLTLMLVCAFFLHASTKVSCVGFITRNLPKGDKLLDIAGFFGYTRFAS